MKIYNDNNNVNTVITKGIDCEKGLMHYEIVIPINEALLAKLNKDMGYLVDKYGVLQTAVRPYLSIIQFEAFEHFEGLFSKWVQRICGMHEGFDLAINNYGITPVGDMYYRIQNPFELDKFFNSFSVVNNYLKDSGLSSAQFEYQPKLMIAGHVQSINAMLEFSAKEIHEILSVNQLWLIRKPVGRPAEKMNVFSLNP